MVNPYVLETKIKPPRVTGNVLYRPRIKNLLVEVFNYRLTMVHAGAGYGKSTTLAMLANETPHVIWYQISEEDQDPFVFLLHLCYATRMVYPDLEGLPTPLLETWDSTRGAQNTREIVFQYLNAIGSGVETPTVLILDDMHLVSDVAEIAHILDRLIGLAPSVLHFVASSRNALQLPNLFRWRSLGQVNYLDQATLSFTEDEITQLFEAYYDVPLTEDEVEDLYAATEGWAIALQLIGQSLTSGSIQSVGEALARQATPLESLFEVLAKDVLEGQSPEIQTFMRESSVLRTMGVEACNWLLEIEDSQDRLDYLLQNDLFVSELGHSEFRYHPIFQQFLYQQLSSLRRGALHERAAVFYQENRQPNAAIYHFIQAEDYFSAAKLLNSYGGQLHAMGHLDTLANYLDLLSPEALSQFPTLIYYMGDLARLHSRFQEALGWYQQSEALWRERGQVDGISRALRGQARIYLDTVNATKAEELLQEALRLSDGITDRETHARLYTLLAENKLNLGKVDEAEKLHNQAEVLRNEGPADSQLINRVRLRTGRHAEAIRALEMQAMEESNEPVHLPRAHRETQLLLSFIYAMQGEGEKALHSAEKGIRRGKALASPFITGVGYMRLGHAIMLTEGYAGYPKAAEQFRQVVEISREISTPRLKVEALWGLTRYHGYRGELEEARTMALTGIQIANQAGDEWIASLTRLAMAASCVLAEQYAEATPWLDDAIRGFQECSDPFGRLAARMWQVLAWFRQDEVELLSPVLVKLLAACQQSNYDYLFIRRTSLGLPDERLVVPLLIWARNHGLGGGYPARLLNQMGFADLQVHPGYQLRVKTFGGLQVWRGSQTVAHGDWQREKTRQIFQLLLTYRHMPLDRDQICEHLWPGIEPEAARRNFKVALNTLYAVLEPDRKAGDESAYVLREGTIYGLRPGCDLWLDVDEFEAYVRRGESLLDTDVDAALLAYRQALDLYRGEYLPEARYQDWSTVEREHLAVLYLQAADQFCELSLRKRNYPQVIEECQRILSQDSCWERAYRHLMQAYDGLGDHGQVARTYQRCVETMKAELNVKPSDETELLFRELTEEK